MKRQPTLKIRTLTISDSTTQVDVVHVVVDYKSGTVHSTDASLQKRVETAVQRLTQALKPVAWEEY